MYGIYSVKCLFESISTPIDCSEKVFEERILLIKTDDPETIPERLVKRFPPDTYDNSAGGVTTIQLVQVLDIFELVEDVEQPIDFTEVYSRHLIFEEEVTTDEAIKIYSLDK